MEKIVTKIGDVTIERRVSKPQPPKAPAEAGKTSLQQQKLLVPNIKPDELKTFSDLTLKQELSTVNKNSLLQNQTSLLKERVDLKTGPLPVQGIHQKLEVSVQDRAQKRDNSFINFGIGKIDTDGKEVRLPKERRINPEEKQFNSNNSINSLINGPDLSKLVGISIERRKRVDIESQPSKPKDFQKDLDPVISAPLVKSEIKEENEFDENDFDDSFDEKDLEDESANEDVLHEEVEPPETVDKDKPSGIKIEKQDDEEISEDVKDFISERVEDVERGLEENKDGQEPTINDLACTDLVELMQKGEIEGEIEDVKDVEEEDDDKNDPKMKEEIEGEKKKKKKKKKKKIKRENEEDEEEDEEEEDEDDDEIEDEDEDDEDEDEDEDEEVDEKGKEKAKDKNIDKSKITNANLRKNIREVMDETKLDEATLAAQRQEAERLKRLQEQQKIIRELQRQIAMSRQNQKTQNKVLSLLQGNSQTSILKTSSAASQTQTSASKSQNSVLVKLSNGEQTSLNNKKMIELLKSSKNKSVFGKAPIPKTLLKQGMVTPSVTIAPVAKKEPADDKKKKDVVTLSSDSEDDCIVLSDEDDSEPEEDPTNSGMHTNDKYNLPDDKGRVVVNVGHPEAETDLYLAPQIARIIKPHQIGGIRFLYDNVIESIERYQTSTGFGCILAHSMGLGKTLQVVSFSDIFLRYTSAKTILCIMPINTIQNWLAEFNMWLPKESNLEDVRCRDFDLFIVNESLKNLNARAKVILDWHKSGGVLLMGYELFRLLSLKKLNKSKKKKKDTEEENAKNRELIEEVYSALVLPGPDLVICDEGHRIKNSHATTSQALKQIRTKRRIVLTGYPLQNNLLEYWCMVDFVRPNYLGTKTEFSNMFERPIQNGQCIDSTPQDKRLMRYRAHVLHSLLEGFVQRRSHAVLQSTLPEKEEYVLLLRFTAFQRKLYDTFMNEVVRTVAVPNPLKAFAVCCKIWNHPDVLYNFLKKKGEEIDLDLEEALPPSFQTPQYPYGQQYLSSENMNQQGQMPGAVAWPKRGPGSRGGKVRQSGIRRVGRGRKPAATITPNIPGQEKPDSFNSGQFPLNENFPNQQDGVENFQARNYNQTQFGFNDYNNQSGNYTNANFNKNPLNNLEVMSSGNFQNKQFFSQQNDSGNQGQYGNMCQNFENSKNSFNPNCSNESNLSSSFDSNLNSTESNYNQNDYSPDFNSDFYSNNNFQNSGNTSNYSAENKPGYQGNSYFQNSGFRNSENFNYQSGGNNLEGNFQNYEHPNSGYQNSGTNSNFQPNSGTNFQSSNRNEAFPNSANSRVQISQGSNFQGNNGGNFQNSSGNHRGNINQSSNFQNQVSGNFQTNFQGNQNFTGQNSNFQGSGSNADRVGENFQGQNPNSNFQGNNYGQGFWPQSNWGYSETSKGNTQSGTNDFMSQKFNSYEEGKEVKNEEKPYSSGNNSAMYNKGSSDYSNFGKSENDSDFPEFEEKGGKPKEDEEEKKEDVKNSELLPKKEDPGLPYDWAIDLFKNYVTGIIENSSKMEVFFHIVTESIKLGDRLLVFSQSLLTLDLIEDYLHRQNVPERTEIWAKSKNYFRLDGSTPGLEREKLINEFNSNTNIYLFLVSTRAGSLGINLVGANRVVVFDASWNPCHDTQAVCRVYRYGQRKPCFVYRLVMDSCLEKKIYDRQVNKQGMADRVVDELNPDAHLSIKEVTNLCWDDQKDTKVKDFSYLKEKYNDEIIKILLDRCSKLLSKEPFQHESLLIDRKEKKLSQAEKKLAKRSYELEKQAANQPKNIYSFFPNANQRNFVKPIASVRPMQSELGSRLNPQLQNRSKWIPAEVWQKQGMSAQEMTLPLDVMIPTSSPEKTSIVLKAGQRVMVLKSPKGIYMQLENGKIIAIRSAFKVGQNNPSAAAPKPDEPKKDGAANKPNLGLSPKMPSHPVRPGMVKQQQPFMKPFAGRIPEKKMPVNMAMARSRQVTGKAKPFMINRKYEPISPDMKQRMMAGKISLNQEVSMERASANERACPNTSFPEEKLYDSPEEKAEDKTEDKSKINDSLETLRKVTESISDTTKRDVTENEGKYPQVNVKNYRQFSSQSKENIMEEEKRNGGDENQEGRKSVQQQGNENVQNWPPNQSFPPVDPYGNYFPGYYYGPGPGPMMPPYDGFYPPSNYGPPVGRNSSAISPGKSQLSDKMKLNSYGTSQTLQNQNTPNPRNPPGVNTPPMYPPYPNPYAYPYNYPGNPNFNNQGYPFSNQNQSGQQATQIPQAANTISGNSNQPYDSSMYSAFHRPDSGFQNLDNPYQPPYPRPPYPNSGTPGFFPYNPPYPNYPYGPNFNPYMHPAGYGYPMQNPVPVNAQNPVPESNLHTSADIANS